MLKYYNEDFDREHAAQPARVRVTMTLRDLALTAGTVASLAAFRVAVPEPSGNYIAAILLFTAGMFYVTAFATWRLQP